MASAAGLNSLGSIRLLANGAPSVTCRPALQAGEANAVKSPASMAAVGTNAGLSEGSCRVFVPWYPAKKNSLSVLSGPPAVPPYWFRFSPSSFRVPSAFFALNGFVALTLWCLRYSNRSP